MTDTKASSFTIGAFIIGAIVVIFAALIFFSGGQLFTKKERVVMYFLGSVQGLQIGAPIKLKGVVLGEVTDIQLDFQSNDKTITNPETLITAVTAELVLERINQKASTGKDDFFIGAIDNGLRAQLNFQSFLTGLLYVELDFHPDVPVTLYNLQSKYRELPTMPMGFEELAKSLQEMNLKGVVSNIDHLTLEIRKIVDSGIIQEVMGNVSKAAVSIERTSSNVNVQVTQLSKNFDATRAEADKLIKQLNTDAPRLAASVDQSMNSFQNSLNEVNKVTATLNETFSEDAMLINQLQDTLEDVSRSARAINNLSETLEQQPESLLRGKRFPADEIREN